jgi:hypothetical protein
MKLTLEILNDDEVIQTREYKTLKAIQNDYPDIEYHQLRAIYLYHSGKEQKKFLHPRTSELVKTLRIKPIQICSIITAGA